MDGVNRGPGLEQATSPFAGDEYEGTCPVCGKAGRFVRAKVAIRESYHCPHCRASLRYQSQALTIVRKHTTKGATCLASLVRERHFRRLVVWEPGSIGPLRQHLSRVRRYEQTVFDPDLPPGPTSDGRRNEDLMALTFPDASIDLIVTSDILEHVRHPERAWAETFRVLRPGGMHIFSIPVRWPPEPTTTRRVDVSGAEDVLLMEPHHHFGHLVYNDFGADLLDELRAAGFDASIDRYETSDPLASRACTFVAAKPIG